MISAGTVISYNILHNATSRIVEIVSIAIAEFTQAEFLGQQDPQVEMKEKFFAFKKVELCVGNIFQISLGESCSNRGVSDPRVVGDKS